MLARDLTRCREFMRIPSQRGVRVSVAHDCPAWPAALVHLLQPGLAHLLVTDDVGSVLAWALKTLGYMKATI